jgi:hypothetical protein
MPYDGVTPREVEPFMPVVLPAHDVRRAPLVPAGFEDFCLPIRLTDLV